MIFVSTLVIAVLLSIILSYTKVIKISPYIYTISLIINFIGIYISFTYAGNDFVIITFIRVLKQGLIGMSFLVIIMMIGALPKKKIIARIFSIRGELSIISVIFLLNHFVYYIYILFKSIPELSVLTKGSLTINLLVSLISIWAWIICIPLFITSFRFVRKKMDAKKWKELQSYAYIMYALVYFHIMLSIFNRPNKYDYAVDIVVYTLIFVVYLCLRLYRITLNKRFDIKKRPLINSFIAVVVLAFIIFNVTFFISKQRYEENKIIEQQRKERLLKEKEKKLAELKNIKEAESDNDYIFKDGEYIGASTGYNGTLSVKVNLVKDQIIDVKFVINNDDIQYVNMAKSILDNIVISNSTKVDIVSGATVTSKAIIKATEDALLKAEDANEK